MATWLYPSSRLALFVDGPNFYHTTKKLDYQLDFQKLFDHFGKKEILVAAHYYTPVWSIKPTEPGDEDFSPQRGLTDWLSFHGWNVVTREVEEDRKRGLHCQIVVDAMEMVATNRLDHFMLCSGDGEFVPLLDVMKRRGIRTTLVSSIMMGQQNVSERLRRTAMNFIELGKMKAEFGRDQSSETK